MACPACDRFDDDLSGVCPDCRAEGWDEQLIGGEIVLMRPDGEAAISAAQRRGRRRRAKRIAAAQSEVRAASRGQVA